MKLLEDTYDSFVRSGALLDDAKKGRLREISQETSVLGPSFMNNVSKSSERIYPRAPHGKNAEGCIRFS